MAYSLALLVNLRTFEAAARHLSFAKAAVELGLTPAAVSQQMKALEAHLGFSLFERLPRGVRLTAIARAYLPSVRKSLDELTTATAGLFGTKGSRSLTIRCPVSYATLCLSPRLPAFRAMHPGVQISVYSSVWADDLDDDRIDLDIRWGSGTRGDGRWENFDATPLDRAVSIPACPPGTVFGPDPAEAVRRLAAVCPIHILGCDNLWSSFARAEGWPEGSLGTGVLVDSTVVALSMVAAGMGTALVSPDLARGHLAEGRIVAPPGLAYGHDGCHHVLIPRRKVQSPLALLFRDWLVEAESTFERRDARVA